MEAELRSCWAGRGTRAGAQENVLGSWELSGKPGRRGSGSAGRQALRSPGRCPRTRAAHPTSYLPRTADSVLQALPDAPFPSSPS